MGWSDSRRVPVVALGIAFALTACGGQSADGRTGPRTETIGYVAVAGGPLGPTSTATGRGLQLGVEDVNGQGGVNGATLRLAVRNAPATAEGASASAEQLVAQDRAAALVGPPDAAACAGATGVSRQHRVLLLGVTCNDHRLTTQPELRNADFVSLVPNTYMEGTALGTDTGRLGSRRVFVVGTGEPAAESVIAAFAAALQKANPSATIVDPPSAWYVPVPADGSAPDWRPTLDAIRAARPDRVFSAATGSAGLAFVRQALAADPGFFDAFPTTALSSVEDLEALGGEYPLHVRLAMRAPFFEPQGPDVQRFAERYRSRFGGYPPDAAVVAYDAVRLYATAAGSARTFATGAVRSQVLGHRFPTLRGGSLTVRPTDGQANAGETIGTTARGDGRYPFPVLSGVTRVSGDDLLLPAGLVRELQSGQCAQADFTSCPSWKG